MGFTISPLLATALYSVKVCSGVTATPYPKAIHGSEMALQVVSEGCGITGTPSPLNGNPNGLFNPILSIRSTNSFGLFL